MCVFGLCVRPIRVWLLDFDVRSPLLIMCSNLNIWYCNFISFIKFSCINLLRDVVEFYTVSNIIHRDKIDNVSTFISPHDSNKQLRILIFIASSWLTRKITIDTIKRVTASTSKNNVPIGLDINWNIIYPHGGAVSEENVWNHQISVNSFYVIVTIEHYAIITLALRDRHYRSFRLL